MYSSGLHIGSSLQATAHPAFHKSWGDSARRPLEKHMQEKIWSREDGTREGRLQQIKLRDGKAS